jgi:hypothetical protein
MTTQDDIAEVTRDLGHLHEGLADAHHQLETLVDTLHDVLATEYTKIQHLLNKAENHAYGAQNTLVAMAEEEEYA